MPVSTRTKNAAPGTVRRSAAGLLTLAGIAFLFPAEVQAQSPVSPGTLSISLGLQEAPEAGLWFTATSHTRIGLLGTLERTSATTEGPGELEDSATRLRYTVGPALRWYLSTSTSGVSPFWYLAGSVGVDDPPEGSRTNAYGGIAAFGVDWFPTPLVSFGGYTGLSFDYERTRTGEITMTDSRLGTLTAGLQMHVYF